MRRARALDTPPDTDRAWAAGFWDGEGCTTVLKSYATIQFTLGQAGDEGEALCQRFLDSVGVEGRVTGPYWGGRRTKGYYMVRITGYRTTKVLAERCWPWLSETKRAQWLRAEASFLSYREKHGVWDFETATACKRGHEINEQNTLYVGEKRWRRCRVCHREAESRRRARLLANA
jgi:hypothetical protein